MSVMRVIYTIVDRIRFFMIVLISAFAVGLCLLQVILRYFTFLSLRPFAWGDEVTLLSTICVIFLACSIGVRGKSHFSVTIMQSRLSPRHRAIAEKVIVIISILGLAIIVWYGAQYALTNTTSTMQNAPVSMAFFYGAIPIGCILMIFEYVLQLIFGDHYADRLLIKRAAKKEPLP